MAGDEGQERSEDPTPRRRKEAREEGRIPKSAEVSTAAILLGGSMALAALGTAGIGRGTRGLMQEATRWLTAEPLTPPAAVQLGLELWVVFAKAFLPFAGALAAVAIAVGLLQSRGVVSWAPVTPKLSNINPASGLKKIFGLQAVITLVKSILKFVVLAFITWRVLDGQWGVVTGLTALAPSEAIVVTRQLLERLCTTTGLAFLVIAGADYGIEVWRFEQSLKMTRQEIIEESKQNDGNPQIKARVRSLQQQMARKRMLSDVKRADVIITNPTHIAVALRYDAAADQAPMVVAMGERKLAERIKAIAAAAGVPMVENKPLARALLATAKVGRPIPVELYTAVAQILAYIYRLRGRLPA